MMEIDYNKILKAIKSVRLDVDFFLLLHTDDFEACKHQLDVNDKMEYSFNDVRIVHSIYANKGIIQPIPNFKMSTEFYRANSPISTTFPPTRI